MCVTQLYDKRHMCSAAFRVRLQPHMHQHNSNRWSESLCSEAETYGLKLSGIGADCILTQCILKHPWKEIFSWF